MQCEICGSHSGFAEDASLLGCDSVPLGERSSPFERDSNEFSFTLNQLINAVTNQAN
jgi:hypothetical protein